MLLIETLRVVHTLVMLLYCQNKRKSSVTNNIKKRKIKKKSVIFLKTKERDLKKLLMYQKKTKKNKTKKRTVKGLMRKKK